MVLRVHCEVVLVRGLGEALGKRPGHEDAVALEPEVPVQAAGVMLLDHEALTEPATAGGGDPWARASSGSRLVRYVSSCPSSSRPFPGDLGVTCSTVPTWRIGECGTANSKRRFTEGDVPRDEADRAGYVRECGPGASSDGGTR